MLENRMPLLSGASVGIGVHNMTREGAITRVVPRGEISVQELDRFLTEYNEMIEMQGFVLIMMDMRESGTMAMPARRKASEWGSKHGHCARTAVFGASFFIRSAIELINRAASLMTGNGPPITFVATEEEARAWLLAQIPQLTRSGANL
jgi:SpoIIAA-like